MTGFRFVLLTAFTFSILLADSAFAAEHKLKADSEPRFRVIVGLELPFTPEGELDANAVREQRHAIAQAQQRLLDELSPNGEQRGVKRFALTPGLALSVTARQLEWLESHRAVRRVEPDFELSAHLDQSVPLVNAPEAWTTWNATGAGYAVAVLDSGVDTNHTFFQGRVVSEACFSTTDSEQDLESVCPNGQAQQFGAGSGMFCDLSIDGCDHGTHVAGIAAGASPFFSGVAKAADIISIQVFSKKTNEDACGEKDSPCVKSTSSDLILGLERVFQLRTQYNIAAVNMSIGGGEYDAHCDEMSIKAAIDNLKSVKIATVISAGNDGLEDKVGYPACVSSAVTVGSTTKLDTVSSFSNMADMVDLLAPGSFIESSVPDPTGNYAYGDSFGTKSGTSMAAPHVAGAFAVVRDAFPTAGVEQTLNMFKITGVPIEDTRFPAYSGKSLLPGMIKPRLYIDMLANSALPGIQQMVDDAELLQDAEKASLEMFESEYGLSMEYVFELVDRYRQLINDNIPCHEIFPGAGC